MNPFRPPDDIGNLFVRLAAREAAAFEEIIQRLGARLRAIARCRLRHEPELAAVYDEEDAIQSGLFQMWRGIMDGTIVPPDGVDSFLRLARTIIGRRIMDRVRREKAGKRDSRPNGEDGWSTGPLGPFVPDAVDLLECGLPRPEAKAIADDLGQWLLSLLGPDLREVATDRVEGKTIAEIAGLRGKSVRTVERMLEQIRTIWSDAIRDQEARRINRRVDR